MLHYMCNMPPHSMLHYTATYCPTVRHLLASKTFSCGDHHNREFETDIQPTHSTERILQQQIKASENQLSQAMEWNGDGDPGIRETRHEGDLVRGRPGTWVQGPRYEGDLGMRETWVRGRPGYEGDLGMRETWV